MKNALLALVAFLALKLGLAATVPLYGTQEKSAWPRADPGPHEVASALLEWKDARRDRAVPVKIYYPKDLTAPAPVIVYSHGTGGSRDGYAYLGNFWASHGYVSVHPQHHGSDRDVFKDNPKILEALKKAAFNPQSAVDRQEDIIFVLDQVTMLNKGDARFKGKFNLDAIGMSGHSFGAHTTFEAAGQAMAGLKVKDSRIKAIIPMSAPLPKLNIDRAYANVHVPTMLMSGTLDDSPLSETKAKDRRVAYDKLAGVDKWFINFEGGDHMIFSGRLAAKGDRKMDADFQRCIKQATLAFWDAYLKNDRAARAWLTGRGLEEYVGKWAKIESKMAR